MIRWDDIFFYCSEQNFWRVNVRNIFTPGTISQRYVNIYLVLVQVVGNFFPLLPYSVVDALAMNTNSNMDPIVQVQIQLSSDIIIIIYYFYLAVSANWSDFIRRNLAYFVFYIIAEFILQVYVCIGKISSTIDRIHLNRCRRQPRMVINWVTSQS